ncbi:hypothetical protein HMPREF3291_04370 [Bacillus sp. HMSC76G11]|nr:hypothetical protein HMPREF3291_04370 [Bacillus sp. HMSC76G11]
MVRDTIKINENSSNSWFEISPERGGIVTSLGLGGQELLYFNKETFLDIYSNIRGGMPILFPICDRLKNNFYTIDDKPYSMKNHGFARNFAWSIKERNIEESSIILTLKSNNVSRKQYPFEFELTFKYLLLNGEFIIYQSYKNLSDKPMPFYSGFHPYFKTSMKQLSVYNDAKCFYDVQKKEVFSFKGELDLRGRNEALFLLDSKNRETRFPISSTESIQLTYGDEFKYVTFWSECNKEYLCVEPWMALPDSLNTKRDLQCLAKGETLNTFIKVRIINNEINPIK